MATLPSTSSSRPSVALPLTMALMAWAGAVSVAAQTGALAAMPNAGVPTIAGGGLGALVLAWRRSPALRGWVAAVGLRRWTLFHAWRIGAAALFFGLGAGGTLPPLLVRDGGTGDLLAGVFALIAVALPFARWRYWGVHLFGAADLIVAMATGITLSTLDPPAMTAVRHLPFALIPMFGVPVTFAAHLAAFSLLRSGDGVR